MYKYVDSPTATHYIKPPPKGRALSCEDVPEAELEMREILLAWLEFGLEPILNTSPGELGDIESQRFYDMNETVSTLLKNSDYYCAAVRIVDQWRDDTVAKTYANYLLVINQKCESLEY
ncbi:hypothetical protein [Vibrio sp. WXL103]|uniref:hypothetical protein n=1 Tax=unclassified Vibrio TaxID=2614977 RepID=UPI003EC7D4DA